MFNKIRYNSIKAELLAQNVQLILVSKTQPIASLQAAYEAGVHVMAENRVQELLKRYEELPKDIEWHLIGHLQTNKVKYIAPFVHCIHSVDSLGLLQEINKRAAQNGRKITCLLQMHIADEESKFGLSETELHTLLKDPSLATLQNIRLEGLMGMGTFTQDSQKTQAEFRQLKAIFERTKQLFPEQTQDWAQLSMGMSGDYPIAVAEGSTMVRIGSLLFG